MDPARIKQFRAQAHLLKPVIIIGQLGLTESVKNEINLTLETHELIKIKIRAEKEQRSDYSAQILDFTKAELIQSIGQIIVIYRKNEKNSKT